MVDAASRVVCDMPMAEQHPSQETVQAEARGAHRFVSQFDELVREGHLRPEPRAVIALVLLGACAMALALHDLFLG